MTDSRRKGQQGRKLPAPKVAAVIAHAELHGNVAAAKKFGISTRTVESYRSRDRAGKSPEVSALVGRYRDEAMRINADLLAETLEKTLKRIQKLLPEANIGECAKVAETLGDLRIQRDYFGGDDASATAGRKDQAPRAPAGRAGGAESPTADNPVH